MTLQQLRYFKTIAEVHTFTKAASILYVTQPTLTHSIHDLEAELQVPLFLRQGRQVVLTNFGEVYLRYVDQVLTTLEEGREILEQMAQGSSGNVILSYLSSLNEYVPYLTSQYRYANPNAQVDFQMSQASTHQVETDLLDGKSELGFATCSHNPDLCYHFLGTHDTVLVVPAQSPWAERSSISVQELQDHPFIAYTKGCGIRGTNDAYLAAHKVRPKVVNTALFDNLIVGMVANNIGVAFIPRPAGYFPRRVRIVPLQEPIPPRELYMLWPKNHKLTPIAQSFRDYIIQNELSLSRFMQEAY